jgi:hypothetical protein
MLNDEIKINKFKKKQKKQTQLALIFETSVSDHESKTNPIEVQLEKNNKSKF